MKEIKVRLNSAKSQNSVNENSFSKINFNNKSRLLPVGEIENVVNSGDRFNLERQSSPYYRLSGTINTLFNNVLFNTTGDNSLKSFNLPKFRDETFPPNAVTVNDLNEDEDLTYAESIEKYLKENNGWFGFQNPDTLNDNLCSWVDVEPRRELFSLTPKNGVKNWELTISYPVKVGNFPGDITHNLVNGGLLLVGVDSSIIGNRNMTTFNTPIKHGLSQGDTIELKGLDSDNGVYTVSRLGQDNGDDKEYYFSVDVNNISLGANPRVIRIVSGVKSIYYLRRFKKVGVRDGNTMEDDDYEVYPLAFSRTIYEDKVPQFVINEDVDISGLKDNLGRPISELYLTVVKVNNNGFTNIKSGIKMPFSGNIGSNLGVPDINRITNDVGTHQALEDEVKISQDEFYGDVVEYNDLLLKERVLGDVYHRFNTLNRETDSNLTNTDFKVPKTQIMLGKRFEGYIYKAHHKIKIRKYSNYIEQGLANTLNKPSYATNLNDGRYIWRDLLDIGVNDTQEEVLDYPFLNGAHYIDSSFNLALKRQDPFNFYGLQYAKFPADSVGTLLDDNYIVKQSQDVC